MGHGGKQKKAFVLLWIQKVWAVFSFLKKVPSPLSPHPPRHKSNIFPLHVTVKELFPHFLINFKHFQHLLIVALVEGSGSGLVLVGGT